MTLNAQPDATQNDVASSPESDTSELTIKNTELGPNNDDFPDDSSHSHNYRDPHVSAYSAAPASYQVPYASVTPLAAPIPRRQLPDLSHIVAPNIEDLRNLQYEELVLEESQYESNDEKLRQEIAGERVVPVHGMGVFACSAYLDPIKEQVKQTAWRQHSSQQNWIVSARARTNYYSLPGVVRPPLRWVLIEDGTIPSNALQTGTEASGEQLYSSRAWFNGGIHPGKAGHHLNGGGASISFGSAEYTISPYEILVGDSSYAQWITINGDISTSNGDMQGYQPMEGGRESSGSFLFIAQGDYASGWHPGKAAYGEDHCCLGYGGGEVWARRFQILVWAVEVPLSVPDPTLVESTPAE